MNEYVIVTDSLCDLTEDMLAAYDIQILSEKDRSVNCFERYLKQGKDILFIGLPSTLSKTTAEAKKAADCLDLFYPSNLVVVIDSVNTVLGERFLAVKASLLRAAGRSIFDVISWIDHPVG